jgi:hypothetical protein
VRLERDVQRQHVAALRQLRLPAEAIVAAVDGRVEIEADDLTAD